MATPPRFVNLGSSKCGLYDEFGNKVYIFPWAQRMLHPDAVYVVEGEHWAQFVGPGRPLSTFPVHATMAERAVAVYVAPPRRSGMRVGDATSLARSGARAQRGTIKITGDVVRAGEVVRDAKPADGGPPDAPPAGGTDPVDGAGSRDGSTATSTASEGSEESGKPAGKSGSGPHPVKRSKK